MAKYAKGRKSYAISDRGGQRVRYTQLKTTWDNLRVAPDEWEPKHPQLTPAKNVIDAQQLFDPRPSNHSQEDVVIYVGYSFDPFLPIQERPPVGCPGHGAVGLIDRIDFESYPEVTGQAGTGGVGAGAYEGDQAATGVAGGLIYNSEGKIFQYYDGSGWISLNTTNQIVATGGSSVSTSGGYRIHDFQSNGTFEITSGFGEVEVLVVGGGGSEGGASSGCHAGGGGGGGGVVYQKINLYAGKYSITVGAGGNWRNNGSNSVFGSGTDNTITVLGGGAGGPTLTGNGNNGGSGGGGSRHTNSNQGGAATQPASADGGFGNAGGNTGPTNTNPCGGGGAGGAGATGNAGGAGGAGKQFTQFGVNIYFGAGGSSAGNNHGAANTGAGAGGSNGGGTRYSGGSGRVMIRYPAAS